MRTTITLNNGVVMPALGFGVFQTPPGSTADAVETALRVGYRHVDTAAAYAAPHGIVTQAWSPVGGITAYRGEGTRTTFTDPVIVGIAERYGKTAAQVMLRWHLQEGRQVIPKSVRPERIAENFDVFDFELTAEELAALDALDTGIRGGPEPEAITLETFGRDIPDE